MKRIGEWWMPDEDEYFGPYFEKHGGTHFQIDRLHEALSYVTGPKRVALDVGAHVGMWTDILAANFALVHAFEPTPDTYACLHQNASEHVWPNVTLHKTPVAEISGRWVSMTGQHRPGNTGSVFMQRGGLSRTVALDDLVFGSVSFMKIDVEGAEALVIEGARTLIARCKPVIIVECKRGFAANFGRSDNAVRMLLEEMGMALVARRSADHVYSWRQE